jgi:hypothetical protein
MELLPAFGRRLVCLPDLSTRGPTVRLLFGLAPVVQAGRVNAAAALKSGTGPRHTIGRTFGSRDVLTVVQVALAVLLIMGAGLFARTLQNLRAVDMGFARDSILLASIDPAKSGYTRPRTVVFFDQLLQWVRAHKEVDAASLASHGSLSGVPAPRSDRRSNRDF